MTFTAEDQEWFTSSIELIVGQIVKSEVGAVEQKLSERIDQVEQKLSERVDQAEQNFPNASIRLM